MPCQKSSSSDEVDLSLRVEGVIGDGDILVARTAQPERLYRSWAWACEDLRSLLRKLLRRLDERERNFGAVYVILLFDSYTAGGDCGD